MIEMDGRDGATCRKSKLRDIDIIFGMLIIIGQNMHSVISYLKSQKEKTWERQWGCLKWNFSFSREKEPLLSRFATNPTIGILRSKKESRYTFSRSDPIGGFEPSSGCETIYWDSLPFFFFSKPNLYLWVMGPHLITESKYHIHIKRTTTGVVSIKIYTHLPRPIYKYKTVFLHLQIRAWNLHVVNPYKSVGPAVCGCFQMSSPVPTRIKNPC